MPILTPQERHKTATHLTQQAERLRKEDRTADAEQAEKLAFSMRQIALHEERQKRIQNLLTPSEIENLRQTARERLEFGRKAFKNHKVDLDRD